MIIKSITRQPTGKVNLRILRGKRHISQQVQVKVDSKILEEAMFIPRSVWQKYDMLTQEEIEYFNNKKARHAEWDKENKKIMEWIDDNMGPNSKTKQFLDTMNYQKDKNKISHLDQSMSWFRKFWNKNKYVIILGAISGTVIYWTVLYPYLHA